MIAISKWYNYSHHDVPLGELLSFLISFSWLNLDVSTFLKSIILNKFMFISFYSVNHIWTCIKAIIDNKFSVLLSQSTTKNQSFFVS